MEKPNDKNIRKCEWCGKSIKKESNRNWNEYRKKRFCCRKCFGESAKKGRIVKCENCGKSFFRSKSLIKKHIYCSHKCEWEKCNIRTKCEICGKEIIKRRSQIKSNKHIYCGMQCQGIAKRKNKGNNQGRRSPEDLAWKIDVLKKAGFKCSLCGTDRKLEAHHIKSIKDFPELRHKISNGQCVCHQCHYYKIHNGMPNFIHGRYSKRGNK